MDLIQRAFVFRKRKNLDTELHTNREGRVRKCREKRPSTRQGKSQPSERIKPANPLISHSQPPEQWDNTFVLVKPPNPLYNSPRKPISEKVKVIVSQLYPIVRLYNPMDCGQPGFSVHGILQARILEWVSIPFSRGSSWPRDWKHISCITGRFSTI